MVRSQRLIAVGLISASATPALLTQAMAYRVQSAEDAARLLAQVEFIERACTATVRSGTREALQALMLEEGATPVRDAAERELEDAARKSGPAAVCAGLADTPGLGIVPTSAGK